jgi:hypothetical protein
MKTFAIRLAVLTAVVGLSSLGYEATAGFRHLRMFRSNCAGPGCWGPSFGCSAPGGCHVPMMMSCGGPACSGPMYVTPPMMTSACSGPGCSVPMWGYSAPMSGGPSCFQPAWTESGAIGYGPAGGIDAAYDSAPVYGSTGAAMPFHGGASFGVQGFSGAHTLPAYYAPMSAQYAPIPPAPAADLVW